MTDDKKPATLQDFKDAMSRLAHGMTKAQAHARGICVECKRLATWSTEAGEREYRISGLCEPCFDKIFEETE